MSVITRDFSYLWLEALADVITEGVSISPRGIITKEVPHKTIIVNMRKPVLLIDERKLNYRFMCAEAYWILSGSNRVDEIAPYNSRISEFSDDGQTFFGAYGPRIMSQMTYIVAKLISDRNTRQAVLTIWRENPEVTKDVPCTVAISFNIRDDKLNAHVFMRSSDLWLGLPYDVFNFSMLAHYVCSLLNKVLSDNDYVSPGKLYLTAASSHLYQTNFEDAQRCITTINLRDQMPTPTRLFLDKDQLMHTLELGRHKGTEVKWWEL